MKANKQQEIITWIHLDDDAPTPTEGTMYLVDTSDGIKIAGWGTINNIPDFYILGDEVGIINDLQLHIEAFAQVPWGWRENDRQNE